MNQRITQFTDETLFFIFYSCAQDVMQQAAAAVLYARDWRYHKELKVWITRNPGQPTQKTGTSERGTYVVFDVASWKKVLLLACFVQFLISRSGTKGDGASL